MFRFLHLGDIHLGYRQYKLSPREQDFYLALKDICLRFASPANSAEKVDFILIAGDLFDSRSASPQTLHRTIHVLQKIKALGVPVIAIEGNHDFRDMGEHTSLKGSWFEVLAEAGLLIFLHPGADPLKPVPEGSMSGGSYFDLKLPNGKLVRLIGSGWLGYRAGDALDTIAKEIHTLPGEPDFTIFLFHGGYEAYFPVNRGGVSMAQFSALEGLIDYIALGHIHQHYIVPDRAGKPWIFNPGSLEPTSSAEIGIERGGLLVKVEEDRSFEVRLITDYRQRSFCKLRPYKAREFQSWSDLEARIRQDALAEISKVQAVDPSQAPLIFISVLGIPSDYHSKQRFESDQLKTEIVTAGALYCQIGHEQTKEDILTPSSYHHLIDRDLLEKSILSEILSQDRSLADPDLVLGRMLNLKSSIDRNSSPEQILEGLA